jgi:hypothetical protein
VNRHWRTPHEVQAVWLCDHQDDLGPRFVELARSIYRNNDERAALKRRLNELAGAPFGEQKEYAGGGHPEATEPASGAPNHTTV